MSKTDISSNLLYDNCYKNVQKQQSSDPGLYQLDKVFTSNKCEIPDVQDVAINRPSFAAKQFRDGVGWTSHDGCNVDKDSGLRIGDKLTNKKYINQLIERPYLTVPYIGNGCLNIDLETQMKPGEDTSQDKPCNLVGKDLTDFRMYPLLPCLKNTIQNKKHLIEEENGWVRSGVPSRQIIRNKDYLKKCGYVYDGKYWKKN